MRRCCVLAVSIIADPRVDPGAERLSLRRARSTWLAAHLVAGTPLPALRAIAGRLSAYRLDMLLAALGDSLDAEAAAVQGLRA